jgi:hypothetical protein
MLTQKEREVVALRDDEGLSFPKIAKRLGVTTQTVNQRYHNAKAKLGEKQAKIDPGIHKTLGGLGLGDLAGQHSGWVHKENTETGEWASVYYFLGKDGQPDQVSLEDLLERAVAKAIPAGIRAPERPAPTGENLLVLDIADLHIGKLCVQSETGHTYDRAEAVRRGTEGAKAILARAQAHGIGHILFVIGNDVIHIDHPHRRTTAGTPQDTDGTLAVMWDDAFAFYVAVIDACRLVAPVTVLYAPSNHDWFAGFSLARAIRAAFAECPEVSASEYNTSHRHRKYFRFGENIIGVSHGDGAKDADLPSLMMYEAGEHMAACTRRYWYLHHLHHKIRKKGAGTGSRQAEKDLTGMTVIRDAAGVPQRDDPEIEYVRTPSPADGWHDRNGYVNRQAVEAFMHHPQDGQFLRLTEWF